VEVAGDLTVTDGGGRSSTLAHLTVNGDATIGHNVETGIAVIAGGLTVATSATLQDQLTVGAGITPSGVKTTLRDDVSIAKNVQVQVAPLAIGTGTLENSLTVDPGGLNPTAAASATQVGGDLQSRSNSAADVGQTLTVRGDMQIMDPSPTGAMLTVHGGTVKADGNTMTTAFLVVHETAALAHTLHVQNNVDVSGDLDVDGSTGIEGSLNVQHDSSVTGTLAASGNLSVQDLAVGQNAYFQDTVTVAGVEMTDALAKQNVLIQGQSTVHGDMKLSDTLAVQGAMSVAGKINAAKDMVVTGNGVLHSDLNVDHNVQAMGDLDVHGKVTVTGGIEGSSVDPAARMIAGISVAMNIIMCCVFVGTLGGGKKGSASSDVEMTSA